MFWIGSVLTLSSRLVVYWPYDLGHSNPQQVTCQHAFSVGPPAPRPNHPALARSLALTLRMRRITLLDARANQAVETGPD